MDKFEEAASILRGVHDFRSFGFQTKETDDTVRELDINVIQANEVSLTQDRFKSIDMYHIHFKSRAFLYNQVSRF